MKAELNKIRDKLQTMVERAEELADSDNQKTADRYQDIPDELEAAIAAIDEAISMLET